MIRSKLKLFIIYIIITGAFLGCATAHKDKLSESNNIDCSLQVQNADSLSAIRYIGILCAIQDGNTKDTVKDIDYWVDLSIIELSFLEIHYPEKNFPEVLVSGSEGILKYRRLYREIARYREEHPRIHTVPLTEEQSKAIASFVKKYK